eukprot:NODE_105_length_19280_cov_0.929461.p14 type:complete len:126 gc:universal NODE_105_length_19280_cov_0.929461:18746-19123(+)
MSQDKKTDQNDLFSPKSKAVFKKSPAGTIVTTEENESVIHPLAYEIHQAITQHEGEEDTQYSYKCSETGCERKFKSAFERNRHERNVHSSPEPCPYCKKMLKTKGRKDLMQRHLKSCTAYKNIQK